MQTTDEIVAEGLKAMKAVSKSHKNNPKKAREFLTKAGILNKSGTALRNHRTK